MSDPVKVMEAEYGGVEVVAWDNGDVVVDVLTSNSEGARFCSTGCEKQSSFVRLLQILSIANDSAREAFLNRMAQAPGSIFDAHDVLSSDPNARLRKG